MQTERYCSNYEKQDTLVIVTGIWYDTVEKYITSEAMSFPMTKNSISIRESETCSEIYYVLCYEEMGIHLLLGFPHLAIETHDQAVEDVPSCKASWGRSSSSGPSDSFPVGLAALSPETILDLSIASLSSASVTRMTVSGFLQSKGKVPKRWQKDVSLT